MKTIFKKGDIVYHWNYGRGRILEIIEGEDYETGYIEVKFRSRIPTFLFNLDGSQVSTNESPTLSFKPYSLADGGFTRKRPRADIKQGQLLYVRELGFSEWKMRYFAEWGVDDKLYCFVGQATSGRCKAWPVYSLTNPLEKKQELIMKSVNLKELD